jgi:hypothetical protein
MPKTKEPHAVAAGPILELPTTERPLGVGDFSIGCEFYCGTRRWLCTDVGSRVIVAISLDPHEVTHFTPGAPGARGHGESHETRVLANDPSWLSGPPYAVAERVFDEDDLLDCSREPVADQAEPQTYYQLELVADVATTEIWLGDDEGFLVQKGIGDLSTGLMPGNYVVEFGLGAPCYAVHLDQSKRLTQAELQAGPTCARPVVCWPRD